MTYILSLTICGARHRESFDTVAEAANAARDFAREALEGDGPEDFAIAFDRDERND